MFWYILTVLSLIVGIAAGYDIKKPEAASRADSGAILLISCVLLALCGVVQIVSAASRAGVCKITSVDLPTYKDQPVRIECEYSAKEKRAEALDIAPKNIPGFDPYCGINHRDCGCLKIEYSYPTGETRMSHASCISLKFREREKY